MTHRAKRLCAGEYIYRGYKISKLESGNWCYRNIETGQHDVVCGGFAVAKGTVDYLLEG